MNFKKLALAAVFCSTAATIGSSVYSYVDTQHTLNDAGLKNIRVGMTRFSTFNHACADGGYLYANKFSGKTADDKEASGTVCHHSWRKKIRIALDNGDALTITRS